MLERLLKHALEDEIALLLREPGRLDLFFRYQNDLVTREIEKIREYFLAHNGAMVVINYPRTKEVTFPLYAIILAEERETQPFIGDSLGIFDALDAEDWNVQALAGTEMIGYLQSQKFHIRVMTEESPDLTLYYYQIAKAALFRRSNQLKEAGVHSLSFSGRDFHPDPNYAPANLFVRELVVECQSTFSILGDIPSDYFTSIDGIYVENVPPIRGVLAQVDVTTLLNDEDEEE